jgi:hypothetical protein
VVTATAAMVTQPGVWQASRHRPAALAAVAILAGGLVAGPAAAQGVSLARGAELFVLDPGTTPVGEFPANIKLLKGIAAVALKDGVPMLKASSVSEFLITLPQRLPETFTVEFELVPKACCNPHDLSVEGTPAINQGPGSAHVLWDSDGYLAVIGGARDNYESPVPGELRASTPGVLTRVVVVVEGTTIKLYTNGRRLYTLADRRFARGRVLRVTLGGQDDGANAVHLARLRVAEGTGDLGIVAAAAGLPTRGAPTGAPAPVVAGETPAALSGSSGLPVVPPGDTGQRQTAQQQSGITGSTPGPVTGATVAAPRAPAPVERSGPPPIPGSLPPRIITLPGFTGFGWVGTLAARTVTLPGFNATGAFVALASRTVSLAGFMASGVFVTLAPRTVTLPGFTATGINAILPARTVTLPGWTAAGAPPTP